VNGFHSAVAVAAAGFSLLGVLWAVWGSFLATKSQHPFTREALWNFVIHEAPMAAMTLLTPPSTRNEKDKARIEQLSLYVELAKPNPDDKRAGLVGMSLIFIGFLFQSVGCLFWVVDALWSGFSRK
jgi:hypothetical protein